MRKITIAFIVAFSCVLAVSGQGKGDSRIEGVKDPSTQWRRITNNADKFSVLMPSAASVTTEKSSEGGRQVLIRSYSAQSGDAVALVGVVDMTAVFTAPDVPKTQEARDSLLAAVIEGAESGFRKELPTEWAVQYVGPTEIGPAYGKLYNIFVDDNEIGRMKIVVNGYRMFMFIAASVNGGDSRDVSLFFDSIQLL